MYKWRTLSTGERKLLLEERRRDGLPWHRPPHRVAEFGSDYLITAACFEHRHHVGYGGKRMEEFAKTLWQTLAKGSEKLYAWCVLPNHYHALISTTSLKPLLGEIGRMHGRLSRQWNIEERTKGRTVWHGATERAMKSERHFFATLNYVHHNSVKHGYVDQWQDWEYSSVHEYLEKVGREEAIRIWKAYPLLDYGKKWDVY